MPPRYDPGTGVLPDGEETEMTKILLTVGNGWMGDDGAGALLAQMVRRSPPDGWVLVEGGATPENFLHNIRDLAPERVLVVDACEMDLIAGSIRFIPLAILSTAYLFTTHTLPLCFLIEALQEFTSQVDLLGIQPDLVAFGMPVSEAVRDAVGHVYDGLKNGQLDWTILEPVEPVC